MSQREIDKLTSKLQDLEIKLKDAKALGDLRENSEFDIAKEELRQTRENIEELKSILEFESLYTPEKGVIDIKSVVDIEYETGEKISVEVGSSSNLFSSKADVMLHANGSPIIKKFMKTKGGEGVVVKDGKLCKYSVKLRE